MFVYMYTVAALRVSLPGTGFSVWPTQFIGLPCFWPTHFFVFSPPSFKRP